MNRDEFASKLWAGCARVDITPANSVEMMGYGLREGPSESVHDPVHARALCLDAGDGQRVLLVVGDLCLIHPSQAQRVRNELERRIGWNPSAIAIGCTHTHSAPDTGYADAIRGEADPPEISRLFDGLIQAGVDAVDALQPARMRWSRGETAIGRNRRFSGGPYDPEVLVLEVQRGDGALIATLFHHGCHGTVLGHENRAISADWAGETCRQLEAHTGAPALFWLGAHADIDPRTRGIKDIAIQGQSLGLGFDAVRAIGGDVAEAVLQTMDHSETNWTEGPISVSIDAVQVYLHLGDRSEEAAKFELEKRKQELADLFGVTVETLPRLSQFVAFALEHIRTLPMEEARERLARGGEYLRDKTAPFFVSGRRQLDLDVQIIRIADAAFIALPLEATSRVGLDWKRRIQRRFSEEIRHAGVASIMNGWLRYLPHADDAEDTNAHRHYEILNSVFRPETAADLLDAGEAALTSVLRGPEAP